MGTLLLQKKSSLGNIFIKISSQIAADSVFQKKNNHRTFSTDSINNYEEEFL